MRRAPPRSSAEIQTCFIIYPWQASLPRGRKCEKKTLGRLRAASQKKRKKYFSHTYIHTWFILLGRSRLRFQNVDDPVWGSRMYVAVHLSAKEGWRIRLSFADVSQKCTGLLSKRCVRYGAFYGGVRCLRRKARCTAYLYCCCGVALHWKGMMHLLRGLWHASSVRFCPWRVWD